MKKNAEGTLELMLTEEFYGDTEVFLSEHDEHTIKDIKVIVTLHDGRQKKLNVAMAEFKWEDIYSDE